MPQAPRDVTVTIGYDAPPAGENVDSVKVTYRKIQDGVIGSPLFANITVDASNSVQLFLSATQADEILVSIQLCNADGCGAQSVDEQHVLHVPAVPGAPTGVVVTSA